MTHIEMHSSLGKIARELFRGGGWPSLLLVSLIVVGFAAPAVAAETREGASTPRPNILFILTDDQGWPTLGSYGAQEVATPNLDSLARDGVKFTAAYVTPQCTPTRASWLSGQHTARIGMWHVLSWYGYPWAPMAEPMFRESFPPEHFTLAKGLREAGYVTGIGGKWHLTTDTYGTYASLKPEHGETFGFDYVAPEGEGNFGKGDKWVDHLTDEAIGFMSRNRDRPWFFYLSHHTVHGPLSAPEGLVEKYRAMGYPEKGHNHAVYLACLEHLDHSIGRLLRALDDFDLSENTMVVFLSDNGGLDTRYNFAGFGSAQANPFDPDQPLPYEFTHRDNAPLRAGKGSHYEGGIRVPCLVRWPGVGQPGLVSDQPIHVVDWMPTLFAAAGAKVPSSYIVDGVDIAPALRDAPLPDRSLYWYLPLYDLRWGATPAAVIRDGDWKLIEFFGDHVDANHRFTLGPHTELYNLREDIGETRNVAAERPDLRDRLRKNLYQWMDSVNAPVPQPNPHAVKSKWFLETREKQPWTPEYGR